MMQETLVDEVMTRHPVTVRAEMPLEDAVRLLAERGISGAPVVDETGRLTGLLDDTDLITPEARLHAPTAVEFLGAYLTLPGEMHRFAAEVKHALAETVGGVMTTDPPRVRASATISDVATIMVDQRVSRVPVVDDSDIVIGLVTRGDLIGAIGRR